MSKIGVKFKDDGKIYYFSSKEELELGEKVIVETQKGRQLGVVAQKDIKEQELELKEIIGRASEDDYNKYLKNLNDADKALKETKQLTKRLKLNMNIIDASYSLDRKVLFFNFLSDERVDFRELVKELASKYHTRIELHQIGVRDKAKEVGGIGMCGRELCCSSFLKNVGSININMVKNQNIALNPTKINGACGRLLCCFTYENCIYEEHKKGMPKVGDKIDYEGKEGKVIEVNILTQQYKLKLNDNTVVEVSKIGNDK